MRAYHLPNCCEVTMLGTQSLPEGVMLGAPGLDRLLRELTVGDDARNLEVADEAGERTN